MSAASPRAGPPARHVRVTALALFGALNWAAAFILGYRYLLAGPPFGSPRGAIFAHLALAAQLGTLVLLFLGAAALPAITRRTSFLARPAAALLATSLQVFLLVDATIFSVFRFHANALVLNVLLTPGGFASMQLPAGLVAGVAAAALALLLLQWWGFGRLERSLGSRTPPVRARAAWAWLAGAVVLAGVAERGIYVAAALRQDTLVPRLARSVPFYQPVSVRRFAGAGGAGPEIDSARVPQGLLRYPLGPVEGRVAADAPSVLWIVLDGWRADLLDPETTPTLWRFSRGAQVFARHASGGNATRTGVFSMFYGLHGTYWHPVLAERRGPVLLGKLREAGYRFAVVAAAPLDYPEFRRTVFAEVPEAIDDRMPGDAWWQKDEAAAGRLVAFLEKLGDDERFFAFLFLDATHNPFESPESHRKFEGAADGVNWLRVGARKDTPELFARYRNAVHWDDALVGRVLRALQRAGRMRRTIVVVTSDHGHEFFERGHFGYNGAFTPEMVDVPLVLAVPGLAPRTHRHRTAHQDLPGTLLRLLGVGDDPAGFTLGRDLFDSSPRPFSVSCSFVECALRDEEGWLVFGTEGPNLLRFEARDPDYAEVDDTAAAVRGRSGGIASALDEMRRFLR